MSDNREPEQTPNPWIKSLLVWGGIFMALLLVVSMFGGTTEVAGTEVSYSDFRAKVAEGSVSDRKCQAESRGAFCIHRTTSKLLGKLVRAQRKW